MSGPYDKIPPVHQGSGSPAAPGQLQRWASMASNIALCGAFVWVVFSCLMVVTELANEFAWIVRLLSVMQFLLVFSLLAVVRKLKRWPGTRRLAYYQFALAFGSLPLVISVAYLISKWLP